MTALDSIVVPVRGHQDITQECLDHLLAQDLVEAEIVVVDDASPDGTAELLAGYGDRIRVVSRADAGGFAAACNDGARAARGEHLVFLNNDVLPRPGWLAAFRRHAECDPEATVLGARLLYPDGTVQHAGVCFRRAPGASGPRNLYPGLPGDHPAVQHSRRMQAVTGALMRIERSAFVRFGGFDAEFVNGFEDVDLCLRVRQAGGEVAYCADVVAVHLESATRGIDRSLFNERLFEERWGEQWEADELLFYVRDGLIAISDDTVLPEIAISPMVGVPARPGAGDDGAELERLLREASDRTQLLAEDLAARPGARLRGLELRHESNGARTVRPLAARENVAGGDPLAVTAHLARITAPLPLTTHAAAPARVNVLVPELRPAHIFAGYAAKLELAARLAARGRRVRIIATDHGIDRRALDDHLRREGHPDLLSAIELAERPEPGQAPLGVSNADTFISTTWWTAHVAHAAVRLVDGDGFVALIQEHERLTLPNGSFAAAADEALTLPHCAVFSTDLLRDHFRAESLGVYAGHGGDGRSAVLRNPLAAVAPPALEHAHARARRGLVLYARPGATEARNSFELAFLALQAAVGTGVFDAGEPRWRFHAVGTPTEAGELPLGGGHVMEMVPRLSILRYAALLRRNDVGLALLHTPHPGLVPFEMAASGLVTVTNTYGVKTAERLTELAPNIVPAEPTVESLCRALAVAVRRSADVEARLAAAAQTGMPRSRDEAYDEESLAAVEALLDCCAPGVRV